MALTPQALAAALRLGDSAHELAEATRLLAVAQVVVAQRAPDAPEILRDEAIIRIAAYFYDKPFNNDSAGHANAMRNSGAGELLLPYVRPRVTI